MITRKILEINRVVNGKITEMDFYYDRFDLLRQLAKVAEPAKT